MKKLMYAGVAVVLAVGLYFGVEYLTQPDVEVGEKEVSVEIIVIEEEEKVIINQTVNTDAEMLSSLLEEMDEADYFTLHLGGEKTDQYGRFLVGFNEYVTEDMSVGPWWSYTSDNNKDCVEAGFCSGVDMAPIYDGDNFVFTFDLSN